MRYQNIVHVYITELWKAPFWEPVTFILCVHYISIFILFACVVHVIILVSILFTCRLKVLSKSLGAVSCQN